MKKSVVGLPFILFMAAGLSACVGVPTENSASQKPRNYFVAPLKTDIQNGLKARVPGGSYWKASKGQQRLIEEQQLSNGLCTTQWGRTFAGVVPFSVPLYPAQNATYWIYSMKRDAQGNLPAMRLTSTFPNARYMSYNLYDNDTGYASGAVRDADIKPDNGSKNPFVPGTNRAVADRDYTIWLVEEGQYDLIARLKAGYGKNNVITVPKSLGEPSVAIRVYLPDSGQDLYGGAGLPTISSFQARPGRSELAPTACPESRNLTLKDIAKLVASGQDGERQDPAQDAFRDVHFYFTPGGGTYPNADARYGATVLNPKLNANHEITQVRFKVPTTPVTRDNASAVFSADDQMRYWSVCLSGLKSTFTSRCVTDEQVVVDEGGYVNLVLGYDKPQLKEHIKANMQGVTFMTYDGFTEPFLLLRHLVPAEGFQNSFHDDNGNFRKAGVHGVIDPETGEPQVANGIDDYWADKTIGEYSPIGKTCSMNNFIKNNGCL